MRECASVLARGGLVVLPTDTVYGVAAAVDQPAAVERMYAAKLRDTGKPIAILAADMHAVERFGAAPGEQEQKLTRLFWPGPLTLITPVRGVDEGFRVPDHALTRDVLRAAGGCLRVTSANRSGAPEALTAAAAMDALGHAVDLIVDAGASPGGVPSSVVRVDAGRLVVLREGALSRFVLQRALGTEEHEKMQARKGRLIVFVCTANMCRSPMAEYLFTADAGRDASWLACSAGTDAGEGMPATQQAVEAMAERGIDVTRHRSRPLSRELVDSSDLVVVMTQSHASRILWRFPDAAPKVRLLKSFLPEVHAEDLDVPDPIGLSSVVYAAIRDLMSEAMPEIMNVLRLMDRQHKRG